MTAVMPRMTLPGKWRSRARRRARGQDLFGNQRAASVDGRAPGAWLPDFRQRVTAVRKFGQIYDVVIWRSTDNR